MKRILLLVAHVFGYCAAVFLVMALTVIPVKLLISDPDSMEPRFELLSIGIMFVVSVFVVNILMKRIGGSQLSLTGWAPFRSSIRWFFTGSATGIIMAGGVLLLTRLSGGGHIGIDTAGLSEYFTFIPLLMFGLLIAALGEEWIFRGYPLIRSSRSLGRIQANILISILFMLGHWGGSGWNTLTTVNIFLFSLVNGIMRFTPGGIATAWGFHFAWNTMYVLLGATLTGENFHVPGLAFSSDGPAWLSGGAYGPEGSISTTLVTIISLLVLPRYFKQQDVPEQGKDVRSGRSSRTRLPGCGPSRESTGVMIRCGKMKSPAVLEALLGQLNRYSCPGLRTKASDSHSIVIGSGADMCFTRGKVPGGCRVSPAM